MNYKHYREKVPFRYPDRSWPDQELTVAPTWCSVDLRDGNQALQTPMTVEQKLFFFRHLVEIGFKTIEIGFPASSPTEYAFARKLIDNDLIPEDVTIQVVTQAKKDQILETFEAVKGAKHVVIHLYSAISDLHRDVVFKMSREEIVNLAVRAAKLMADCAQKDTSGTRFSLEYSPETFTQTDPDFAVYVCDAVSEVWLAANVEEVIMNLVGTVESSMPNIYADQVEYFCRNIKRRDEITISIHTHNDRSSGVAATELGILAGGERVEGTLFGNGERSGNADLVALALNLMSQGIDPELDLSDIDRTVEIYELSTGMEVHPRHPYAGDLVYTAFSGSHQDAVRKGLAERQDDEFWNVPYLPIDPFDVGRSYEPLIRITAQSGKGGIAYVMEKRHGYEMPKAFLRELSRTVTRFVDKAKVQLDAGDILSIFKRTYENITSPLKLLNWDEHMLSDTEVCAEAVLWESPIGTDTEPVKLVNNIVQSDDVDGRAIQLEGTGHGLAEAIGSALSAYLGRDLNITLYRQHALEQTASSKVVTYIGITSGIKIAYGCGLSGNFTKSSLRALVSAVNRLLIDEAMD